VHGEYTVEAPVGKLVIEAHKGFDYWPVRQEVQVKAGQTAEVALTLKPHVDLTAKGWFNGSTHVHMNYGGNLHNTPANLMMNGQRAGDAYCECAGGQQRQPDSGLAGFQAGRERAPASNLAEHSLLVFGEENGRHLGHTFYIGLRDHLISPFLTGYEGNGAEQPVSHEHGAVSQGSGAGRGDGLRPCVLAASRIRSKAKI